MHRYFFLSDLVLLGSCEFFHFELEVSSEWTRAMKLKESGVWTNWEEEGMLGGNSEYVLMWKQYNYDSSREF